MLGAMLWVAAGAGSLCAADAAQEQTGDNDETTSRDILTPQEWSRLDQSVDRALAWLAKQQRPDGSFPTLRPGQPAVTALCTLAFVSRGHLPGSGPYGTVIDKGIAFTLSCQHPDGLLAREYPSMAMAAHNPVHTANYNHSIAGLMLSEVYGMTSGRTNVRIRAAIEQALVHVWKRQPSPKRNPADEGGWRYGKYRQHMDSDLSVTSWHLMFLRSCRNAGFDIPIEYIDGALAFVRRCYDERAGCFVYAPRGRVVSRAMTGAGILALSHGGKHRTEVAQKAAAWVLRHPFEPYNSVMDSRDAYLYGAFYCSQAMLQLGGRYWKAFFPRLAKTLIANQRQDGSWPPDAGRGDLFGNVYSTSLAVLTLTTPYQLLPILQR